MKRFQKLGEDSVNNLFDFLNEWNSYIPLLRVVIVGRARVTTFKTEELKLGNFDEMAAIGFLESQGIDNVDTAKFIYQKLGGNPLTLQLAVDIINKEGFVEEFSVIFIIETGLSIK